MLQCYFCDEKYPIKIMEKKKVFDPDLKETLEVNICPDCSCAYDDGLLQNPNQDFN